MLDIKFVRENPELVRENIRKKFQEQKLPLVDAAIDYDRKKFTPHITLIRKVNGNWKSVPAPKGDMMVKSISLMKSEQKVFIMKHREQEFQKA